jgi:dihydroxyacetone kinase-like protein
MKSKQVVQVLQAMNETIAQEAQYLTDLDAAIGDGDHGINMKRGFAAVSTKLEGETTEDCGAVLKTVAMTLISTVGGASGPLYGTAFLKAAQAASGKTELTKEDGLAILTAAVEGVQFRGKAERGEKTMLDLLIPVKEAYAEALEQGLSLAETKQKLLAVMEESIAFTKTIIATKGRASYLGERSLGHQDPGATSSYFLIKTLLDSVE